MRICRDAPRVRTKMSATAQPTLTSISIAADEGPTHALRAMTVAGGLVLWVGLSRSLSRC